jgi:acyl-CoA synthetase (AMP-forming)/AMP-acid ligase II
MADGRTLTYRDLEDTSNQLAHLFRSVGLQTGDHIAVVMENRPEFLVVALAAYRSGLYWTPCSTELTGHELDYIITDSRATLLIATTDTFDAAREVSSSRLVLRLLIGGTEPGWTTFEEALASRPRTPIPDQWVGDALLYTSGSTGQPKGVKRPLPGVPFPQEMESGLDLLFGLNQSTVYLSPAPLYHAAPLLLGAIVTGAGGTTVVQEHFDPEQFLALIERHKVTFTQVVPTMFTRLLQLPAGVRARYDLSSLKGAVHVAAPCPIGVKEQMIDWWGPIIFEYYAGTELNGMTYCNSEEWLTHKGTVGRSLLGAIHILDDDGNELPLGKPGIVFFEGGDFEYQGDAAKTAGARDPRGHGWTTLGDIGYVDEEGYLYLTDRKFFMIISGGVNIYPQESENVLVTHPLVADVAVFGIPDEEMGESVHAVVQPLAGTEPSPALAAELIEYCRERLAHYKCPRSVDFRTELPRSEAGKLYKGLLKAAYWKDRALTS